MRAPWYMKEIRTDKGIRLQIHWLWIWWQRLKYYFRKLVMLMGDWRETSQGPIYTGPSDETLLYHITAFGTRTGCTWAELIKQFGHGRAAYAETTEQQIARMVNEGKVIDMERNGVRWIVSK